MDRVCDVSSHMASVFLLGIEINPQRFRLNTPEFLELFGVAASNVEVKHRS